MNTIQMPTAQSKIKRGTEMILNNKSVWVIKDREDGLVTICNAADLKTYDIDDTWIVLKSDLTPLLRVRSSIVVKAVEPIKKVSDKMAKLLRVYNVLANQFKKNNPICLATVECSGSPTTEVHHRKGRGEYLLDESTFLPVCGNCHKWIEAHPKLSKEYGLSGDRL
jgi:hypothetical protein